MAWAPGEGGGGFQKWASVPGPLFCVRTDVATEGAGTQITSKRVVRSSAGAYAIYPPFLGSFAYNTPKYGTGCPTPCKIIILGEKMIPQ